MPVGRSAEVKVGSEIGGSGWEVDGVEFGGSEGWYNGEGVTAKIHPREEE